MTTQWVLKSWHESHIVSRDGDLIATVYSDKHRKLIAAAPEMRTALRGLLFKMAQGPVAENDLCVTQALAALAKAGTQ